MPAIIGRLRDIVNELVVVELFDFVIDGWGRGTDILVDGWGQGMHVQSHLHSFALPKPDAAILLVLDLKERTTPSLSNDIDFRIFHRINGQIFLLWNRVNHWKKVTERKTYHLSMVQPVKPLC